MQPEEKTTEVKRHFDAVARRYDLMNTVLSFGLHHLWKQRAVGLLGLKPGERAVDVCGGTADLALLAAQEVGPTGGVVLYDINRAMMLAGLSKVAQAGLAGRIWFVEGDAECLAVADKSLDAALVGFGVRNLARMEEALQEMHRALKPGGRLLILEFSRPSNPLWRWLYDRYSFLVMPLLGQLIAGSREAYAYLTTSIRQFPLPEELAATLRSIGFSQVTYHPLSNGIAMIHLAVKHRDFGGGGQGSRTPGPSPNPLSGHCLWLEP
jgi:demethylmenaquinone methyltransferase/2-methoxy-6-polyprenyl-1,4-benzoquinol methylase